MWSNLELKPKTNKPTTNTIHIRQKQYTQNKEKTKMENPKIENQDKIEKASETKIGLMCKASIRGLFQAKASRRDQPCLAIER
jgi:hypothetical protein